MTSQRIGSHYLLHEQIGQGGMGAVWRAEDTEAGVWRAVKVLRPEYARDPAAVARFVRERNALVALRHPNVVTLHDMIVEGDRLARILGLEHLDGAPVPRLHVFRAPHRAHAALANLLVQQVMTTDSLEGHKRRL